MDKPGRCRVRSGEGPQRVDCQKSGAFSGSSVGKGEILPWELGPERRAGGSAFTDMYSVDKGATNRPSWPTLSC